MARRRASDAPFRPDRIREGLAAGCVVEIDLAAAADGLVLLHDERLDDETSGAGLLRETPRAALAALRLRGEGGAAPVTVEALGRLVAGLPPATGAVDAHLQIDVKLSAADLRESDLEAAAAALAPLGPRAVFSGEDYALASRFAAAVPGARRGFDPLALAAADPPESAEDWRRFVRNTLAAAPGADWFYLYHRFVAAAAATGVALVEAARAEGARVDVWTLDPYTPGHADALDMALAQGADQITTNDAEGWARLRGG